MANTPEKRIKIRLIGLGIFTILLVFTTGAFSQALFSFWDSQNFSPAGDFYTFDGFALHMYCTGAGSPTILLESDFTFPAKQWYLVQRDLARHNRVCVYDRGGMGWSDASSLPRKAIEMTQELYQLLRKANIDDKLLVVGYLRGTWLVRLFAYNYPDLVEGVVLIEPIDETYFDQIQSTNKRQLDRSADSYRAMSAVTWFGFTRFVGRTSLFDWFTHPFNDLSVDAKNEILALTIYDPQYWIYAAKELDSTSSFIKELEKRRNLGNLPLFILTNSYRDTVFFETNQILSDVNLYLTRQEALAQISTNSQITECDKCGLMPPITAPDEVIAIIQKAINFSKP
jgi:pimeloyl-ACP methyl ester carboxylesterase